MSLKQKEIDIELFEASASGSIDRIKAALKEGGNPNFYHLPEDQKCSLHIACENGNFEASRILLDKGAKVNAVSATSQSTPLMYAVQSGKYDVTQLLLSMHALIDAENGYGNTALHIACRNGNVDIAYFLIDEGAKCNVSNHKGSNPLHFCGYSKLDYSAAKRLINILISKGTNLEGVDCHGNTPLLAACIGGNIAVVESLIDAGADKSVRNLDGEDAAAIAAFYNHLDIIKMFIKDNHK
jgi:serine/threonine-protein phosphatase 6 regulatory ankyrin repeat subunit B